MWWRIVAWFSALALLLMLVASGCRAPANGPKCNDDDCGDPPIAAQPICSDLCVEEPDDGFTGPNWYWLGSPAEMPLCPGDAPLDGIRAYADSSPAVEPPCASAQAVQWGFVARECKITTHPTCKLAGTTCAAAPPAGYSLCIYQDDEAHCPTSYPTSHRLLREQPETTCAGMGVEPITLCCALPVEPA